MTDLTALAEQLDSAKSETMIKGLLPSSFNLSEYAIFDKEFIDTYFEGHDDLIFVDIETIPSDTPPSIDEIKVPGNIKKPESILAYKTNPDNIKEQHHKESLISHKGRVFCISIAVNDSPVISLIGRQERHIFKQLDDILKGHQRVKWIGQYIREFDMLWIYQRAIKYKCSNILKAINPDKYKGNIIDIMNLMGRNIDYKYKISLDNIARLLELQTSKQGIDGSQVFQFWLDGKYKEIISYCDDDVRLTREIYNYITNLT